MKDRVNKRARLSLVVSAAVGTVLCAAVGAGSALCVHFAQRIVTPSRRPEEDVEVVDVDQDQGLVWIQGTHSALPGKYSFIFDGGKAHARLGDVVDRVTVRGALRVSRQITSDDEGRLRAGARGRITGWWFTSPEELPLKSKLVTIQLEGGRSWGWVIEPSQESAKEGADPQHWAVHVHGRGALPQETLRGVSAFARAGITSLVIAYRNDPGAPPGFRGRYGLGLAERHDVDAAIDWAHQQGATRVTLAGYSMGGTAVILAVNQGHHRDTIDGLVLDSPALDWPAILKQQARLAHVPAWVASLGEQLLRAGLVRGAIPGRRGTEFASLTPESLAEGLRVPVLIHASPEDTFVPWEGAMRVAELQPALVTLREGAGEHVKLWNADPEGWEAATETFLARLRKL